MKFLEDDWCNLKWTPWVRFGDKRNMKLIPKNAGLYRVKPVGMKRLAYIGQTGRDLRERLSDLINNTLKREMPFNDPHTAAPSLWAWKDAEGMEFECSAAAITIDKREREGMECYLLWQYRLEYGQSTMCNHGRFHKNYCKSGSRSSKKRGYYLPDGEINHAGGISYKPLLFVGQPHDTGWMGLRWSEIMLLTPEEVKNLPNVFGVYKILAPQTKDLLYIGESIKLRNRLVNHSKKKWGLNPVAFAFCLLPEVKLIHQLKELENDLIGGYYALTKMVPMFQFKNHK